MLRLAVADLRESWLQWASVALTSLSTSACLGLASLVLASGMLGDLPAGSPVEARELVIADGGVNVVLCVLVGLALVGASTGLVVRARRGALARLALAGSTPGQVTAFLLTQLVVVSLACAVVGMTLAIVLLPSAMQVLGEDRGFPPPSAVYPPALLLLVPVACALVAIVGGFRQARVASALLPVEALRAATDGGTGRWSRGRLALRLLGVIGGIVALVLMWLVMMAAARDPEAGRGAGSMVMQLSILSLAVTGCTLATAGPLVVGPLATLITTILPVPDASWHLARQTVIAKGDRLVRSVVALMFTIGLLCGFAAFSATMQDSLDAAMSGIQLEGTSVTSILTLMLLPLVIAASGSVGNLVMMSRQRDAELALDGVVGATPLQQTLVPVFEALILTLVASVLGLVMAVVSTAFVYAGMNEIYDGRAVLSFPPLLLLGVVACCFVVSVAATVLPTLPSLRRPAPTVIARLVAE